MNRINQPDSSTYQLDGIHYFGSPIGNTVLP